MNRKEFFKKLGAGAVVAAVAPKVLTEIPEKATIKPPVRIDVSEIPDGMTCEEFLRIWRETGHLIIRTTTPVVTTTLE